MGREEDPKAWRRVGSAHAPLKAVPYDKLMVTTHARAHARTHAHTRARTRTAHIQNARARARAYTRTRVMPVPAAGLRAAHAHAQAGRGVAKLYTRRLRRGGGTLGVSYEA